MSAPEINHHREGHGAPLVLIHGVGHHWQAWQPVIERLAGELDVIACDSPGFGRSAPLPPGASLTVGAYAEAFASWLAEQGIEQPHVAGNSMGGGIALELARRGVAASATAFSPVGFWTPAERRFSQLSLSLLRQLPAPLRPALLAAMRTSLGRRALLAQLYGFPARLPAEEAVGTLRDAWAAPAFTGALAAFEDYDFTRGEELRDVPVTIAWGIHDRLLLYGRQAPRARARLPWARHVSLGAGHAPYHDDPAAVAETIRQTVAAAGAKKISQTRG